MAWSVAKFAGWQVWQVAGLVGTLMILTGSLLLILQGRKPRRELPHDRIDLERVIRGELARAATSGVPLKRLAEATNQSETFLKSFAQALSGVQVKDNVVRLEPAIEVDVAMPITPHGGAPSEKPSPPQSKPVIPASFSSAPSTTAGAPIYELDEWIEPGHSIRGNSVRLTLRIGTGGGIAAIAALAASMRPLLGCTVWTPEGIPYVHDGMRQGPDGVSTLFPEHFAGAPEGLAAGPYRVEWTRGAIAHPIAQDTFTVEGQ